LNITILYDVIRSEEKMLVKAAQTRNLDMNLLCSKNLFFDLQQELDKDSYGNIILQRCVGYFRSLHLTSFLESKGIKVVNGLKESFVAGNKLNSTLALISAGIPVPRTYLSFNKEAALQALDELGYPAIIKPTIGSWGRLIGIMKDPESSESILEDREHMFPLYQIYYLQEKVKRPPRDIRAFVIGNKVEAAIYRTSAENQWKTNTSRGGKAENCPITNELEDLCLKAARAVGEGIFGVDLMESPDGLLVHEVNNTVEFRNSVPATGIDIPGLIINYLIELNRK
jgi:[lysine-biosynthesis-protein LysW]--L-2-aminoadipate ligase